eukprot:403373696
MAIKSLFCGTFLLTLLSLLSLTQAKREWGLCQAVKSDIPDKIMNVTKMMGIWYEYLITPQLKENQTYSCASWLMMQDQPTDARFAVIYNQFDTNNNDSHIRTFEMNCEPTQYITNTAVCYYQANTPKNLLESYTTDRIKSLRIIYTDYYSYLIARVCQSYGLFYYQDYIVLTRDKVPSIYHRKQMKEKLAEYGLGPQDFEKGESFQCWGEDFWN